MKPSWQETVGIDFQFVVIVDLVLFQERVEGAIAFSIKQFRRAANKLTAYKDLRNGDAAADPF